MVSLSPNNSYRMLVYNGLPVREQRRISDKIKVLFYNGDAKLVSEREWRNHSRQVFVPKEFGTRKHVANNWNKYQKLVLDTTE